jgi:hypothetical protein
MHEALYLVVVFFIPALMVSSIIIVRRNKWWAWICWLLIAASALHLQYQAHTSTDGVAQALAGALGGLLMWMSLTAFVIWVFKPLWMKIAPESLWLRIMASAPVFLSVIDSAA